MLPSRRILLIGGGSLALLLAVYVGLWWWGEALLRHRIQRYVAAEAAEGITLTSATLEIEGSILDPTARLTAVVLHGIPHIPAAEVRASTLTVESRPWQPGSWRIKAPEGIVLVLPTAAGPVLLGAAEAEGKAERGPDHEQDLRLKATGLTINPPGAPGTRVTAGDLDLHVSLPQNPPEDHTGESMRFTLGLDGIKLPAAIGPLAGSIDRVALDGVVQGPVHHAPLKTALSAWRDDGGTVELHKVLLAWGGLVLQADGTLALDQNLQPLAAFSAAVTGWPAMLDALVAAGSLKPDQAAFARIGLALLAHPGPHGESELKTPITLQNGQLYIEKARVAKLPTIAWP